jgi:hypothetical protein
MLHLLCAKQLLEKNSPTTQQQLLPKLIDDQSFVKEASIASTVTVSASPSVVSVPSFIYSFRFHSRSC